jgi:hypothetical protein
MDSIPLELISMVAHQLQQWNFDNEIFSHLTETNVCKTDGWLDYTRASRQDICNFRLVCHSFRNGSLSTFGNLLGDRTFRLTKVGIEDLQAISASTSLRPYIQTLTFGNARFLRLHRNKYLQDLLKRVPEAHRSRLHRAYHDAFVWQTCNGEFNSKPRLVPVFTRLPNLTTIRCRVFDNSPKNGRADSDFHLGGWLSPGDERFFAQRTYSTRRNSYISHPLYFMDNYDLDPFLPVVNAIQASGRGIQDFQLRMKPNDVSWYVPKLLDNSGILSGLRRLLTDIDPNCLHRYIHESPDEALVDAFTCLTNLTHLSLGLSRSNMQHRAYNLALGNLAKLLKPLKRLEQLTLRGDWGYHEEAVVDLVTEHSESLRLFALKSPALYSENWESVVSQLVQLQSCSLKFLELSDMRLKRPGETGYPAEVSVLAFESLTDWEEFVETVKRVIEDKATYTVHLSCPHGRYIFQPPVT